MADNQKMQRPIDKRTAGRYMEKGILKDSDFQNHLKNLPDEMPNATWVELDLEEAELSQGSDEEVDAEDDATPSEDSTVEGA